MQLVINYRNQVSTTSILVAKKFEKRHADVLRAIENLECSPGFRERNFALTLNITGLPSGGVRRDKGYVLSRDGFTMLVMSFTGAKSAQFKEEFIEEFNRMEAILRQGQAPVLIPVYQERILSEPTKGCPTTHFNVFDASHPIMLFIEKHIGSVSKYDLVDGSIGQRWAKYREDKLWVEDPSTYVHEYTDERGPRSCKCYTNSEYTHFKEWLIKVYKTTYLYDYLHSKYTREKNRVMLDKVEELLPKLLKP
jgi:Rha family phage regulatory protein